MSKRQPGYKTVTNRDILRVTDFCFSGDNPAAHQ